MADYDTADLHHDEIEGLKCEIASYIEDNRRHADALAAKDAEIERLQERLRDKTSLAVKMESSIAALERVVEAARSLSGDIYGFVPDTAHEQFAAALAALNPDTPKPGGSP